MSAITIISQNITKELSTASTNWLLANAGDKLKIETTFKIQIVAISSSDTPMTLNKTDGLIGTGWLYDPDNQFVDFYVGDSVKVWDYNAGSTLGDYTIIAKNGNGLIQLNAAISGGNNIFHESVTVSNTTAITAIKYRYNFIKNNAAPTFVSPLDVNNPQMEQIFAIDHKAANDTGSSNMKAMGAYEWQDGFSDGSDPIQAKTYDLVGSSVYPATIVGVSIDNGSTDGIYKSTYKITHYTKLPPFFLYQQTEPPYAGTNCLKLITKLEARPVYTNPNIIQSDVYDQILGNTGWYNENFNTGITNYKITNLVYKNSGGGVIPSIELTSSATVIEFDVENVTDSPFIAVPTANYTKFVVGFHKIPADPSEYQNTGKLKDYNFLYDRMIGAPGGSANNGQNYYTNSGDYTVLIGDTYTLVSASKIHLKFKVQMAQKVIDSFASSSNKEFALTLQIRKTALATNLGDDVTLIVDKNTLYIDNSDPTMIGFGSKNKIFRHPEKLLTEGVDYPTAVNVFPEDELSAYTEFYIDSTGRTNDVIKITSVKLRVIAAGTTTFTLDEFTANTAAYPFQGYAQFFDVNIADQFHIPTTEAIRKYYRVVREPQFDTGGKYYFKAIYPFLIRWEYWAAALGIDSSFFDTTEPNNGLNEWWYRYGVGSWKLWYEIEVNATKNGIPQQYKSKQPFTMNNYASNSDFTTKTIKTYDLAGNELVNGGTRFISGYENTEIRAVFSNINTPNTGADNYTAGVVVIGIEAFESGGIAGKRRYSSKWPADSDTWFTYLTGSTDKVKLSSAPLGGGGHTVTAKCYIDYSQLPPNVDTFKITARIYDNIAGTWQEECITQVVSLIPSNPVPKFAEISVPTNPNPGCCNDFVIQVLADDSGIDLQNDKTGFLYWFEPIVTGATMELKRWDGSAWSIVDNLTNNDCGTLYPFGFFTNQYNQPFIGYQMDWAAVLSNYGAGSYKVTVTYTMPLFDPQTFDSHEYCLNTYSPAVADGTVRLEYWLNGQTGDIEDDIKVKDFGNLNWYNSLRVRGYFGYPKDSYTSEDVQYVNGQSVFVEDMREPIFNLHLKLLAQFLHEIIRTDFMMADRLAVTDYNSRNSIKYVQKFVRKNSGYEPNYHKMISDLASVDLEFKQESNRFRKFRV